MTPANKRDLYQAEDDAWSRAFELALTPVVAGGVGYLIDRLVGTVPLFTIILLVMAVVATFVKLYYAYDADMKAHDAESPWGRARAHADARTKAAAQPALSTPASSTPALSTPALSTPALSTPALSTPALSTPALSTPGTRQ